MTSPRRPGADDPLYPLWWLIVRPLSHAGVRVHKAAFDELLPDPAQDGGFLEARQELLEWSLAHLAGEEVVFGHDVRDRR